MLPQNTDWFRNCVAVEPHEYDSPTSTREKLERRTEFDRWLAEVKAQAIYDWVRLVQGKDNFTIDNARSFVDTMRIAEEDD